MQAPLAENEAARITALRKYAILFKDLTARDVMTSPVTCLNRDTAVADAAEVRWCADQALADFASRRSPGCVSCYQLIAQDAQVILYADETFGSNAPPPQADRSIRES